MFPSVSGLTVNDNDNTNREVRMWKLIFFVFVCHNKTVLTSH